jgi:DNA-binding CsgD family transcriptional regulator
VYDCSNTLASSSSLTQAFAPSRSDLLSSNHRQTDPFMAWSESLRSTCMALMLDEIDYGLILLAADGRVAYMNHAAHSELRQQGALTIKSERIKAFRPQDADQLRIVLSDAQLKAKRGLITLGAGLASLTLAVIPLTPLASHAATLVILGKSRVCEDLSIQCFATNFGLTLTESAVLKMLCAGLSPNVIAEQNGVAISTVRTQIHSIRNKTTSDSIASLVRQVAQLPPLVGALRQFSACANQLGMDNANA